MERNDNWRDSMRDGSLETKKALKRRVRDNGGTILINDINGKMRDGIKVEALEVVGSKISCHFKAT